MRISVLAAVLAAFLIPGATFAQQCIPAAKLKADAREKHGEHLAVTGLSHRGGLLVIFIDPHDGSWTAGLEVPGQDCVIIVDHGEAARVHPIGTEG